MKAILAVVMLVASSVLIGCNGNVFSLKSGDCFNGAATGNVSDVTVVQCTVAHDEEVYFVVNYTPDSSTYPGDTAVGSFADTQCGNAFEAFDGKSYDESSLSVNYLTPTSDSWGAGDRVIDCMVHSSDGTQLTGSMRGSNQ